MADEDPVATTGHPDAPDFISQDGRTEMYPLGPISSGYHHVGSTTPAFVPKESTPLEEKDDDGVMPHAALSGP